MDIPNSVTTIGKNAFYKCSGLTGELKIPDSVKYLSGFCECTGLTSVDFGNGVTTIGYQAFDCCIRLTSVNIPNSVTEIGSSAFYNCSGLTGELKIPDSVTEIGTYAFGGCTGLTGELKIPDSVTTIEDHAFYGCSGLTSVTIGTGVTTIGSSAFYKCTGLTSVTIGNSVTEIGSYAFEYCSSLTSVAIPDSVTTIGNWAFSECTGLTSVTLGNSLTSIDYRAYYDCSSLKRIYSLNPEPPECINSYGNGWKVFDGVDKEACTLYVPIGSYNAYATADQWEEFLNIVEMDMTGIESVSVDDLEVVGYYTIDGKAVENPQRGVNIVRYSDGSTRKVMMK